MKYLKIIFITLFVQQVFAQDSQLFENTWYLQNVIIDNNDNFPPPSPNDDFEFIEATFSNDNSFVTTVCASLSGVITYDNDTFLFDSSAITLIGCGIQENQDYDDLYIGFYFTDIDENFSYDIISENSNLVLTVISQSGDMAIYSNKLLSLEGFREYDFVLFPNPVKNTVYIENKFQHEIKEITVSDINGKLIHKRTIKNESITFDISDYQSGIYFVRIVSSNGNVSTFKFIKD